MRTSPAFLSVVTAVSVFAFGCAEADDGGSSSNNLNGAPSGTEPAGNGTVPDGSSPGPSSPNIAPPTPNSSAPVTNPQPNTLPPTPVGGPATTDVPAPNTGVAPTPVDSPVVPQGGGGPGPVPVPVGNAGTPGVGGAPAPVVTPSGGGAAPGPVGGSPAGGAMSSGGAPPMGGAEGPCDIYEAGGTPCVGAYSTVRRLLSTYTGPLYQVRSGSNAQNTGSGGETHDIGITADGFADAAAQDAVCQGTLCTISLIYDQTGRGNDLPVAKKGRSDGGATAAMDDFESVADDGPLTVGGHQVYSLYMEARQGYRMTRAGDGIPRGEEAQGLYMLADGTHYGTACCWDFGNVTSNPMEYHTMNTLFFGTAYWGRGAGSGPWFMADFEAGVWAGGSNPSDPGWGALDTNAPPNMNNPSLGVPFAIGFLKTDRDYALRMADISTANSLTTAYEGPLPKPMENQGAIVIGVGGDNSNNSWGTFFEGAVVSGYPSAETEDAVMLNVKAAGYGQ